MSVNRYQETKIKNARYKTANYPGFPKQQSDLYIISREQDRLDLLSNEFYEDPRYWWVLAKVNNLGHGTLIVPEGIQLRIPMPLPNLGLAYRAVEDNK
tara:strand:+ start:281 stop:574 length:294 start_codon:yes stop_codon:yes gene_type:complete